MITVATLLWKPNAHSFDFSRAYDETWVDKLYRGVARNLTGPFRFACFTDQPYRFGEPVEQEPIYSGKPDYGTCIEPYRLGEPMILMGLDTVIVGNIDALAEYCLTANQIAVPRDPYYPDRACNGVTLVPAGRADMYTRHNGENDMDWVNAHPHALIDDLFPGQVVSYKGHVMDRGLGDARIVYFHGRLKPHELQLDWIAEHWR